MAIAVNGMDESDRWFWLYCIAFVLAFVTATLYMSHRRKTSYDGVKLSDLLYGLVGLLFAPFLVFEMLYRMSHGQVLIAFIAVYVTYTVIYVSGYRLLHWIGRLIVAAMRKLES